MNKKQTYEPYRPIEGETWKKIKDYDNYEISDFGRVRLGEYIVMPSDRLGYKTVRINKPGEKRKNSFLIHRLVAEAFIPNPQRKPEVDHIDTNKSNNKLSNLRWCWHLENMVGNPITFSRLNKISEGFRKKTIYESIRLDLYYSKKNHSEIIYDEDVKKTVKDTIGETTDHLLNYLYPSNFGTKTVNNLHTKPEKKEKEKIKSDSKVNVFIALNDLHAGMAVTYKNKKGSIVGIDTIVGRITVNVPGFGNINFNAKDLVFI